MAELTDRALDQVLENLRSGKDVRHVVLAVESGDGSFRWRGALGDADPDGTPMQEDTPFFLASVSKLYIATVILKLHERGVVGLDESMTAHLPAPLTRGLHRLGGVDYTERITIRHLLSHTSGLPDWLEDSPEHGPPVVERIFTGEDRSLGIEFVTATVRDELEPHFPPQPMDQERVSVRYSDTNYQLLMAIIERAVDTPLAQVYEEMLFRPLGLHSTWLPGHEPLEPTLPPATLWVGSEPLDRPLAFQSLGDLYSTVDDTIRFLRAVLDGHAFDDPATSKRMRRRWNRFRVPTDRAALRLPSWPVEYGLGMMRFRLPRMFTPLRPVPAVIGHSGSTGSWLFHAPGLDLFLSGTVDQATAGAIPFRAVPKILRAVRNVR